MNPSVNSRVWLVGGRCDSCLRILLLLSLTGPALLSCLACSVWVWTGCIRVCLLLSVSRQRTRLLLCVVFLALLAVWVLILCSYLVYGYGRDGPGVALGVLAGCVVDWLGAVFVWSVLVRYVSVSVIVRL